MRIAVLAIFLFFTVTGFSQYMDRDSKYIGLKPKTDYNPYANKGTNNVNILPFIAEYRIEDYRGVQVRPVLDLSFGNGKKTQLSNMGLSLAYNMYFSDAIKRNFWIKPNAAVFVAYTYNRINKAHTTSLGVEPSVSFLFNPHFLLTAGLNPSLSYFIGKNSRDAMGSRTGFRAGWGMFIHLGINLYDVMY